MATEQSANDGGNEGYEVARQHRNAQDTTASGHAKYTFIRVFD